MVRTYAANPSTQSAGIFGRQQPPEVVDNARYLKPEPKIQSYPPDVPISHPQNQNHVPFNELSLLNSSLSSSSTNEKQPSAYVIPGNTQLFGVRSILVNGQQFYQPIDPQLNYLINKEFASLGLLDEKKRQNSSVPSDPVQSQRNENDYYRTTMAAFQMAHMDPNNQPAPNQRVSAQPKNLQMFDENNQRQVQKPFSELDKAIERNPLGIPINYNNFSLPGKMPPTDKDMIDDLPWARGNPQPKSGKRGTYDWNSSQRIAPVPSSLYADSDPYSSFHSAPPLPVHLPSLNMRADANSYGSFYNDPVSMARSAYMPSNNQSYSATFNSYQQPIRNEKEQHKYDLLQQIEDNKRRKEMEKMREQEIENREMWRAEIMQARQQAELDAEKNAAKEKALSVERKALAAQKTVEQHKNYVNRSKRADSRDNSRQEQRRRNPSGDGSRPGSKKLEWWEKKTDYNNQRNKSPVIPALRNKDGQNGSNNNNNFEQASRNQERDSTPIPRHQRNDSSASRRSASHTPVPIRNQPQLARPESRPIRPMARQPSISSRGSEFDNPPQFDRADQSLRRLSHIERELDDERHRVQSAINKNRYDHAVFD